MKKIVLMATMLLSVLTLNAKKGNNPVVLKSGNVSVFQKEATANVVIDDHKVLIDGTGKTADVYYGEKNVAEYEKFISDIERGHESFITSFNEKKGSKIKFVLSGSDVDTQYTLKVDISVMNVGHAGGIWAMKKKAGGVFINGAMKLIENATGKVICEFEFNNLQGRKGYTFQQRISNCYATLGECFNEAIQQ